MRRPVVYVAIAFTLGIVWQHLMELNRMVLLGCLGVEFILFFVLMNRNRDAKMNFIFMMMALVISGAFWLNTEDLKTSAISNYEKRQITGEGIVKSGVKKDENYYKLIVETRMIFNKKVVENTIINYYGNLEESYSVNDFVGRKIRFEGQVSLPDKMRNPKTFDYREYLKTIKIFTLIKANPEGISFFKEIDGNNNKVINYLSKVKGEISKKLIEAIGKKRCGVFSGMMWGEKGNIDEDVMDQFRMNGTAHILAVSGIHVGLVYLYLNKLLWGRKNLFFDIIIIMLLICYAAMAAFSPSVMRAVIMIVVHIVFKHTHSRYDFLSCGAATFFFMLIINPNALFNIGFQLSFLAIFSLAVLLPFLQKIHNSFITPIIALQFGLSPLTAFVFNYFSLGSVIANIPIIFIASLIIPLGLLTVPIVIFRLPDFLFDLFTAPIGYLMDAMLAINDLVYSPGNSFFYIKSPSILCMILYYFLLFFTTSEVFLIMVKRGKYSLIKKIIGIVVVGAIFVNGMGLSEFDKAQIIFVDVGQGDCLHIKTGSGKNILIDGGGSLNYDVGVKVLMPYLLKNGVDKIDLAFATHLHQDHYSGLVALSKRKMIKQLYIYEANKVNESKIMKETTLKKNQLNYLVKGDKIMVGEDVLIEVLSPEKRSDLAYEELSQEKADENEKSLILKVNYNGTSLLMTGDIDFNGEKELINQFSGTNVLNATILKITHHGSKYGTSDEFLKEVDPTVAVIQVGKNSFGHPNGMVIEKIWENNTKLYRNDWNGAVGISFVKAQQGGEGLKIITLYE